MQHITDNLNAVAAILCKCPDALVGHKLSEDRRKALFLFEVDDQSVVDAAAAGTLEVPCGAFVRARRQLIQIAKAAQPHRRRK